MATITGKAGAILIAAAGGSAAAVNGKVTLWELDYEGQYAETPGAGDTVMERVPLRKDWTIRGEFLAPDQASWGLHEDLVNASVIISLKRKSGDTNPYATCATALLARLTVSAPFDNAIKASFEVKCSGTDLTIDTTPAT